MLKKLWIKYKLWSLKKEFASIDYESTFYLIHIVSKSQYIKTDEMDEMISAQNKYRVKRKEEVVKKIKELQEELKKLS